VNIENLFSIHNVENAKQQSSLVPLNSYYFVQVAWHQNDKEKWPRLLSELFLLGSLLVF